MTPCVLLAVSPVHRMTRAWQSWPWHCPSPWRSAASGGWWASGSVSAHCRQSCTRGFSAAPSCATSLLGPSTAAWGKSPAQVRTRIGTSSVVALEPEGFGCGITPSCSGVVGVWASPSRDSLCPPGPGEPSKSLSVLSRDTLKLIPRRVEVKLENTSMVLSMNSQKR